LSLDGVISFSYVPLRLASLAGIFMCFLSLVGVAWVLWLKLGSRLDVPGWASTMLPILGLSGFQLLVLGLMGEYLGRLYIEVKQRPVFLVRKEYDHGNQA
jgi:dolichol-phosphate mannosyltransferase